MPQMTRTNSALLLSCLFALAMLTACGEPVGPKTEPVTGVVTLDDAPVEGATVTFSPSPTGQAASGITDKTGTYKLTTFKAGDGAVVGTYKVSVAKTEGEQSGPSLEGLSEEEATKKAAEQYYKSSAFKDMGNPKSGGTKTKELLPAKYKEAAKSGLTADVKSGQENKFDFKLSSK